MPQKNRTVKGVLGGLLGLVGLSAVAGLLVTTSVTPVLAMTGIAGTQAISLFEELPGNLDVNTPMEQSVIYAKDAAGNPFPLASFYEQNRVPVTFDQLSPNLINAILSSEDKNFYSHGGVNFGATVKALVDNVRKTSSRGASTITQQFVKNVQIQDCEQKADSASETYQTDLQQCWQDATNAEGADGIERKLQEMRYAIQIEKVSSKNDILLGYLNIANFGGTVYGIEAASNYYFSTSTANLSIAQAATLAGIVQNPNTYRIDKPEAGTYTDEDGVAHNNAADGYAYALDRRDYVLGRMLADGKITQAEYDEAKASPITPAITQPTQGCAAAGRNAYFCQYVKSIVENDPAFGDSPDERRDLLRRGGLQIYTTLDMRIQDPAAQTMADIVPASYGQYLGAAGTSIEVGTGRILAMTQNTSFLETPTEDQAYSSLVFAGDKKNGNSNGFQVGSTYKLFTLIDWLEKGHSVRETLNGRVQTNLKMKICGDTVTADTKKIGNFGGGQGGTNSVMNFTAQSLNSGFFAMAAKSDICDINKVADRMGVTLANGGKTTDQNVPFDVLGSKNISPLAMANAYATVASGGTLCTPRAIDQVLNSDGSEHEIPPISCKEGVISAEVAATAAFALQGVMAGGGTGAVANPRDGTPLIGKTGTHDTWSTMMIESSTKVATAVWVGRWQGQENIYRQRANGYLLNEMRYPLARVMQEAANAAYGGDAFPQPDNNLVRQVLTDVPAVTGMTVEDATAALEAAGFSVSVGAPVDSDQATNIIVAQDPSGQAPAGATVTISPSNGQGATVPADLVGKSRTEAFAMLAGVGLNSQFDTSCNPQASRVISTDPAPGTATNKSTTVNVVCQ